MGKNRFFIPFVIRCIENYCQNEEFAPIFDGALKPLMPRNKKIDCEIYCVLLYNLQYHQSEEKALETIKKLEEITTANADNWNVSDMYLLSLFRLAGYQSEEKVLETINRAEAFAEFHADSSTIAEKYVEGLIWLAGYQSEENALEIINKAEKFVEAHADNEELTKEYLESLKLLSFSGIRATERKTNGTVIV